MALLGIALPSLSGIFSVAFAAPAEPLAPGADLPVFVGHADNARANAPDFTAL